MGTGRAVCIGVCEVAPDRIGISLSRLASCDCDAMRMQALLLEQGFLYARYFRTEDALRDDVTAAIHQASLDSKAGDLFVLTFSGHGVQDKTRDANERDRLDEFWILRDGAWVDNDIRMALKDFVAGVRILVVSDSCHSGTVTSLLGTWADGSLAELSRDEQILKVRGLNAIQPKEIPKDLWNLYKREEWAYLSARLSEPIVEAGAIDASVLLLAACSEDDVTLSGSPNSAFTTALLDVFGETPAPATYDELVTRIGQYPPASLPFLNDDDVKDARGAIPFRKQRPFSI
ncbi:MAG: family peptidase [Gemmatimonadetes bacterium]|nr:family peptidase [Gemmatimonadota bacterium]